MEYLCLSVRLPLIKMVSLGRTSNLDRDHMTLNSLCLRVEKVCRCKVE